MLPSVEERSHRLGPQEADVTKGNWDILAEAKRQMDEGPNFEFGGH